MGTKEEDYKEMFIAEALGNYEELNKLFTSLEKDINNKKAVNHIFRITHTLKGNAMGMGFEAIAELAHVMEDVFSEVKDGKIELDEDLFNNLFKANDKLGALIEAITSEKKVNYKGIRTKLSVFMKNARAEREEGNAEEVEEIKKEEKVVEENDVDNSEESLFDKIGGIEAVDAAVEIFYKKVLDDDSIKDFFDGVDIKKQKAKQKAFLAFAFGGPVEYKGKDMQAAHAGLVKKGLNENHFNAVADHLKATLNELKVKDSFIEEVMTIALSVKDDVLSGSDKPANTVEDKTAKDLSLFDRIGGAVAINAAVDLFYKKILKDDLIKHFFEGVDLKEQKNKQKAFLAYVFGGPVEYSGKDLRTAHEGLVLKGLNEEHFEAVVEHLENTLKELKLSTEIIDEVLAIALSVKEHVLGGPEDGKVDSEESVEEKDGGELKATLFHRIGGAKALDIAVDRFYKKVLDDIRVSNFFEGVDMKKQKLKQKAFLAHVLGGPVEYSGKDLRKAHAYLVVNGMNETHFNVIIEHLTATLVELNVIQDDINEVIAIAMSAKDDILAGPVITDKKDTNEVSEIDAQLVIEDEEEEEDDEDEPKIVFSDLVQVPVRKLDSLMNLVGELIIERDSLVSENAQHGFNSNMFARLQRITSDLQYGVMDVRLIQIGFLFNKFHRIIRDVAAIENKKVDLLLEGTEIEIDRNILKIMSDSLIHLIRNSVSHGIEKPNERKKKGKPERGTVTLKARNEKDTVIIEISDDGNGIDHKAIAAKAIKMGIVSEEYVKFATKDELIMLIFEPGFSNADKITEVSGRGVGMDVVKKATESIGGNLKVSTDIGVGSTISLALPSSMAVKGALLFELNNQEYAVALSYTEAVISFTKADIHKVSNGLMASYLGKTISVIFLNDLYEIRNLDDLSDETSLHKTFDAISEDQKLDVLVASYANKYVGFVVDKLLQQKEIVEKTLEPPLNEIDLVSGATILGNGNVCLVLDIANIIGTLFKDKN